MTSPKLPLRGRTGPQPRRGGVMLGAMKLDTDGSWVVRQPPTPGRHVRARSPDVMARIHVGNRKTQLWWDAHPELKAERDERFYAGAAIHNGPRLSEYTCCAVVRGKRCSRITIIETGHRHCHRHAGPTAARH